MRSVAVAAPAGRAYQLATGRERLLEAWQLVAENNGSAGVDGVTVEAFDADLYGNLSRLGSELALRTYAPLPLRRVTIPKPDGGTRLLGIPSIRDRVAQSALLLTLTPTAERRFLPCSFGYRQERNAHQAIDVVEAYRNDGRTWVVNADISKCFDSLDQDMVLARLGGLCDDADVLALVGQWIRVATIDPAQGLTAPRTRGIPQGAPISPLLANLYLHSLDQHMLAEGWSWVRYADDFLCLTTSEAQAGAALQSLKQFVEQRLHLQLKPGRSGITSFDQGFEFLGFTFTGTTKFIGPGRVDELRQRIGHDTALQHLSVKYRLRHANQRIAGFAAYYHTLDPVVETQLRDLDGWVVPTVRRNLGLSAEEVSELRSFLSVKPWTGRSRDFYLDLLALIDDQASEVKEAPVQRRVSTVVRDDSPSPPRPTEKRAPPSRAALDPPARVVVATPQPAVVSVASEHPYREDAPVVVPVVVTNVSSEPLATEEVHARALFLGEGYAKEDLREFLRHAAIDDRPIRATDGTLFVELHGCALGKVSQQLVVRKGGDEVAHYALRDLEQVVIQAIGVVLSTTLLRELALRSVPIHFLDWRGKPFGQFQPPERGSPAILRGQLHAYDGATGVQIAREMLAAKGKNQLELLLLYARYRRRRDREVAHVLDAAIALMQRNVDAFDRVEGPCVEAIRGRLLAIEGRIAAAHFRAIASLVGPRAGFTTRTRQGEDFDPINSLLDYAYGLLYTRCHRALVQAGLDPRLGFVHSDAPGKLSLLYDFVEEFRALAADRPVVALVVRGMSVRRIADGRLALATRRRVIEAFARNLESRCRYHGERRLLGDIIDAQARHLAAVLGSGSPRRYRAFRYNH